LAIYGIWKFGDVKDESIAIDALPFAVDLYFVIVRRGQREYAGLPPALRATHVRFRDVVVGRADVGVGNLHG
jgi:hypothetical protein